jgi:hypothetical protein
VIAMAWERDVPDDVAEDRRRRGHAALDALNRLFVSPRNSRTGAMRPWHRGIYLSYSNMAADSDWKPMDWQVEILEGMVALYSVVTVDLGDGTERTCV